MPELVPVRVRDCACPDSPHEEGDLVFLVPTLPLEGGILAEQQMLATSDDPEKLIRLWVRTFTEHGAVAWNLVDADGEPVPFDLDVLLADWRLARPVADKGAELYGDAVTAPFLPEPSPRSPTGRTKGTNGPSTRTTSRHRSPTPLSSA